MKLMTRALKTPPIVQIKFLLRFPQHNTSPPFPGIPARFCSLGNEPFDPEYHHRSQPMTAKNRNVFDTTMIILSSIRRRPNLINHESNRSHVHNEEDISQRSSTKVEMVPDGLSIVEIKGKGTWNWLLAHPTTVESQHIPK